MIYRNGYQTYPQNFLPPAPDPTSDGGSDPGAQAADTSWNQLANRVRNSPGATSSQTGAAGGANGAPVASGGSPGMVAGASWDTGLPLWVWLLVVGAVLYVATSK